MPTKSISRCVIAVINVASLLLLAADAAGQTASDWENVKAIAPGTELRVALGTGGPIQGSLESVTDRDLVLTQGTRSRSFPRPEIMSVSIKQKSHRLRSTLIGAGVGTAAGIGIGVAVGATQASGCRQLLCGLAVPVDAAVLGAAGLAVGTVIGLVWPMGGWRGIYSR